MFFHELLKRKRLWFGLLAPLSLLLTILAHRSPSYTERWFSMGIYQILTETYGRIFGILPFSISQFLIIIFPLIVIIYTFYEAYVLCSARGYGYTHTKRQVRLKSCARLVTNFSCTIGIIAFMFTMGAGLNYARLEFGEIAGLEVKPSPVSELVTLGEILAADLNELAPLVNRNENGEMILSGSHFATAREAQVAFRATAEEFPVLRGYVPLVKPIIYSEFMSRLRITGIYSPFTMEAHVNVHVPDYHIPFTMMHEIAHFRGIMREDEANFIGWLASKRSDSPDFMYSGAIMAFSHTRTQLRRASYYDYRRIMDSLVDEVRTDFAANSRYWQQFTGPLADISTAANDRYLRANRQEDGVASYGRMVDLLLAYFR